VPNDKWYEGNIVRLWRSPAQGLELWFCTTLLALRYASVSYALKRVWRTSPRRNTWVDVYCLLELALLIWLLCTEPRFPKLPSCVAAYIVFEAYLNLFNIAFVGKNENITRPPLSIERSIILMLLNAAQVTFAFAVFYKTYGVADPLYNAVLVIGTIGAPADVLVHSIVAAQVASDILLLVLFLGTFAGQLNVFGRRGGDNGVIQAVVKDSTAP
jgi:hypothetical protein